MTWMIHSYIDKKNLPTYEWFRVTHCDHKKTKLGKVKFRETADKILFRPLGLVSTVQGREQDVYSSKFKFILRRKRKIIHPSALRSQNLNSSQSNKTRNRNFVVREIFKKRFFSNWTRNILIRESARLWRLDKLQD